MAPAPIHPRLLPALATLATPATAVFAVLFALDQLSALATVAGWAVTIFLTAVLLRPYGGDMALIERHLRDLENDAAHRAPRVDTSGANRVLAAIGRLHRNHLARAAKLDSQVVFHQRLFDTLPSPLFLVNRQRRIVMMNAAAKIIFGIDGPNRDLAAVVRHPPLLDAVDIALSGGPAGEIEFEAPVIERDFRAMIEPLPEDGTGTARIVLALYDITALKRMEVMRADFVANASHELRTPLSALLGFIETLQGPARDDKQAHERFLAIMYDQATRMARLIEDLLALSRIELDELTLPAGKVAIAPILTRVAETLEPTARKRRMTISLRLAPDLPDVVGKEDELAQLMLNLVDNALKYGREETPVTIKAWIPPTPPAGFGAERALAIAVLDQGEGIAREHIPRLTERFFRVDNARSRSLGGTGLGLAIVKHIVNRHRGTLTVESTLGEGSCFTVHLPMPKA